jgi:hypothetical protein
MALIVFNEAKYLLSLEQVNLLTDTLKVMLVTPGYIPDANHTYVDDGTILSPSNYEVAGTGYIGGWEGSGRRTVTNKSVIKDTNTSKTRLFGDDVLWNPINVGPVGGVVLFREGEESDETSLLIGYTNEGGFPILTDGGELQIRWHTNGIYAM